MRNLENKLLDIENIKNKFTKMGFGKKQYFFTIKIVLFGGYT